VTVVDGVVVTVVAVQHVAVLQWPDEQTTDPAFEFQPSGQVKLAQVGSGVVVTVVTRLQHNSLVHLCPVFPQ